MDDGSAVAFMQMNGQTLSNILAKSSVERREEMETLLRAAFTEIQKVPLSSSLVVVLDYLAILKEMNAIFTVISTTSTYEIARVCCRSLTYSK